MPSQKDNILQFNQNMRSDEMPYIIYADLEPLIKKKRWVCKQPRKIFHKKIVEHIPSRYSISATWAFANRKHNHTLHGGEDSMKKTKVKVNLLKIKIIEKLKAIAILQLNIEVQHIVYVT